LQQCERLSKLNNRLQTLKPAYAPASFFRKKRSKKTFIGCFLFVCAAALPYLSFTPPFQFCTFVIPMKNLDLKESLQLLRTGEWLHIRYITADITKGKGGTIIELPKARLVMKRSDDPDSYNPNADNSKKQNHHFNFTLNLELPNRNIRKIHPILITHINSVPLI
jgi:hypothetical protein